MNEYTVTTDYDSNPNALKEYPTDIYYYVGKNQLEIYVNDVKLGKEQYDEIVNGVPADLITLKEKTMSKIFRLYCNLKIGDKIVYKITNFDEHKM